MSSGLYIDTWHIHGPLDGSPYTVTVYGIASEADARMVVKDLLLAGICKRVHIVHTTKETPRARWMRQEFLLTKDAI